MRTEQEMRPGFFNLQAPTEPEPCLVIGYHCTDMNGKFVFGFNTHDGGGLIPFEDLVEGTIITPVEIIAQTDQRFVASEGI